MRRFFSDALNADIMQTVQAELDQHGILNVPAVAAAIRSRHSDENVALEDIQYAVLHEGQGRNAAMAFDGFDLNAQTIALTMTSLTN